ncbi:bacterioferritin-associated ferredoxin [Pseudonocardia parietis]|uniref:Bacterioferritin-associated ferredoxin n=1 Tax=Pseudonocardia parietis TaxID=570936 RepID=A0ABS4VWH1_9PSEU|nr:bacterioferritin-associated ferredoxin [Pseudonocardia parietis]
MFACICAAVTETEVRACVSDGARCVDSIGDACGAGTGCGSCHGRLETLLTAAFAGEQISRLPTSA